MPHIKYPKHTCKIITIIDKIKHTIKYELKTT